MQAITKFTQADYMNGKCTHRQYYAQFVTPAIMEGVVARFGKEKLANCLARDGNLNNIPLHKWDGLAGNFVKEVSEAMKAHGDFASLAGMVCVLKEAAKQAVERGAA